jgi:hypothetical protein
MVSAMPETNPPTKEKGQDRRPCPSGAVDLFYLAISTEATVMLSPVTLPFTVT